MIGEAELEDILAANGFRIAYPETMTIDDQVRLINGHTDIVSSLGSAAHTILFALHRPRLHLLANRDDIPANYFLCSALAEAPTTFVNCLGSGGRVTANDERINRRAESFENETKVRPVDLDAGPQSMPQFLDFATAVDYLEQRGLVRHRPPPAQRRRSPHCRSNSTKPGCTRACARLPPKRRCPRRSKPRRSPARRHRGR